MVAYELRYLGAAILQSGKGARELHYPEIRDWRERMAKEAATFPGNSKPLIARGKKLTELVLFARSRWCFVADWWHAWAQGELGDPVQAGSDVWFARPDKLAGSKGHRMTVR